VLVDVVVGWRSPAGDGSAGWPGFL
jgi:hypothetical protein